MTPKFINTMRIRLEPQEATQLPPQMPIMRNPAKEWDELREYASKVAEVATKTSEANRNLIAENEALQRRIEHLEIQNGQLLREQRIAQAFAQNLRSRATAVKEALEALERESIAAGHAAGPETSFNLTSQEKADIATVGDGIVRLNPAPPLSYPSTKLPPNTW